MSTLMKRSLVTLFACGLTAGMAMAQGGTPSTPPMPSSEQVRDAVKEAQTRAEELKRKAEDAVNKAAGHAGGAEHPHAMPDEKMMAEMAKAMQPGPMHAWLKKWEGRWDLELKSYLSPGSEPEVMRMTSVGEMTMNGRFLVERVSGEIELPGMGKVPFEGVSTTGYDNMQKKFVSTWYDSMSTGMMVEFGTVDDTGKVLTCEGENWNMHAQAMTKTRSVCTIVDDNTRTLEMWAPGPDGAMMKQMHITYTRK